jgi:rhodanese-related sulfurtransferase
MQKSSRNFSKMPLEEQPGENTFFVRREFGVNQRKTMQMIPQNQDTSRARAYFEQKVAFTTGPVELDHAIKAHENIVIVDVREAEDYAKAHIPGAINLPKGTWDNPEGLQKNRTNVVYCYTQQCHLAANACVRFASQGFPVMEMDGGFEAWQENELDTEKGSSRMGAGQSAFSR